MPDLRYHIVPQGLMMSVNGEPTYWSDRKASFGILWEHIDDTQVEILRHGRVEMILEREASFNAFYTELGAEAPRASKAFVTVEHLDHETIDTLNRVLAGEEKPIVIATAMQKLARQALLRVMPAHKRYMLEAA
ncbi:hypothetical protein [Microvirga sp. VF16]|uniref:hypothetical protein n=1 Tax=Microvirga sp. VF16 TaxID=2807101 RepID=UPI00193D16F2|nr:hypothetical protein [Microvirga sp. VF16]QRM34931.1 hypothetical protein JO965_42485 [Microvirga sp. VF16]